MLCTTLEVPAIAQSFASVKTEIVWNWGNSCSGIFGLTVNREVTTDTGSDAYPGAFGSEGSELGRRHLPYEGQASEGTI